MQSVTHDGKKSRWTPFNNSADCPSIEPCLSPDQRERISKILTQVSELSDVEKFLLYLKLPTGEEGDVTSRCASRSETPSLQWVKTHYTEAKDVFVPKQDVYQHYKADFESTGATPLGSGDFGKVVKAAFPNIYHRRLGQRGKSKYCYGGLKRRNMETPILPHLHVPSKAKEVDAVQDAREISSLACKLICEWAGQLLNKHFAQTESLARYLVSVGVAAGQTASLFTLRSGSTSPPREGDRKSMSCHQDTQSMLRGKLQRNEVLREHKQRLQRQQQHQRDLQQSSQLCGTKSAFSPAISPVKSQDQSHSQTYRGPGYLTPILIWDVSDQAKNSVGKNMKLSRSRSSLESQSSLKDTMEIFQTSVRSSQGTKLNLQASSRLASLLTPSKEIESCRVSFDPKTTTLSCSQFLPSAEKTVDSSSPSLSTTHEAVLNTSHHKRNGGRLSPDRWEERKRRCTTSLGVVKQKSMEGGHRDSSETCLNLPLRPYSCPIPQELLRTMQESTTMDSSMFPESRVSTVLSSVPGSKDESEIDFLSLAVPDDVILQESSPLQKVVVQESVKKKKKKKTQVSSPEEFVKPEGQKTSSSFHLVQKPTVISPPRSAILSGGSCPNLKQSSDGDDAGSTRSNYTILNSLLSSASTEIPDSLRRKEVESASSSLSNCGSLLSTFTASFPSVAQSQTDLRNGVHPLGSSPCQPHTVDDAFVFSSLSTRSAFVPVSSQKGLSTGQLNAQCTVRGQDQSTNSVDTPVTNSEVSDDRMDVISTSSKETSSGFKVVQCIHKNNERLTIDPSPQSCKGASSNSNFVGSEESLPTDGSSYALPVEIGSGESLVSSEAPTATIDTSMENQTSQPPEASGDNGQATVTSDAVSSLTVECVTPIPSQATKSKSARSSNTTPTGTTPNTPPKRQSKNRFTPIRPKLGPGPSTPSPKKIDMRPVSTLLMEQRVRTAHELIAGLATNYPGEVTVQMPAELLGLPSPRKSRSSDVLVTIGPAGKSSSPANLRPSSSTSCVSIAPASSTTGVTIATGKTSGLVTIAAGTPSASSKLVPMPAGNNALVIQDQSAPVPLISPQDVRVLVEPVSQSNTTGIVTSPIIGSPLLPKTAKLLHPSTPQRQSSVPPAISPRVIVLPPNPGAVSGIPQATGSIIVKDNKGNMYELDRNTDTANGSASLQQLLQADSAPSNTSSSVLSIGEISGHVVGPDALGQTYLLVPNATTVSSPSQSKPLSQASIPTSMSQAAAPNQVLSVATNTPQAIHNLNHSLSDSSSSQSCPQAAVAEIPFSNTNQLDVQSTLLSIPTSSTQEPPGRNSCQVETPSVASAVFPSSGTILAPSTSSTSSGLLSSQASSSSALLTELSQLASRKEATKASGPPEWQLSIQHNSAASAFTKCGVSVKKQSPTKSVAEDVCKDILIKKVAPSVSVSSDIFQEKFNEGGEVHKEEAIMREVDTKKEKQEKELIVPKGMKQVAGEGVDKNREEKGDVKDCPKVSEIQPAGLARKRKASGSHEDDKEDKKRLNSTCSEPADKTDDVFIVGSTEQVKRSERRLSKSKEVVIKDSKTNLAVQLKEQPSEACARPPVDPRKTDIEESKDTEEWLGILGENKSLTVKQALTLWKHLQQGGKSGKYRKCDSDAKSKNDSSTSEANNATENDDSCGPHEENPSKSIGTSQSLTPVTQLSSTTNSASMSNDPDCHLTPSSSGNSRRARPGRRNVSLNLESVESDALLDMEPSLDHHLVGDMSDSSTTRPEQKTSVGVVARSAKPSIIPRKSKTNTTSHTFSPSTLLSYQMILNKKASESKAGQDQMKTVNVGLENTGQGNVKKTVENSVTVKDLSRNPEICENHAGQPRRSRSCVREILQSGTQFKQELSSCFSHKNILKQQTGTKGGPVEGFSDSSRLTVSRSDHNFRVGFSSLRNNLSGHNNASQAPVSSSSGLTNSVPTTPVIRERRKDCKIGQDSSSSTSLLESDLPVDVVDFITESMPSGNPFHIPSEDGAFSSQGINSFLAECSSLSTLSESDSVTSFSFQEPDASSVQTSLFGRSLSVPNTVPDLPQVYGCDMWGNVEQPVPQIAPRKQQESNKEQTGQGIHADQLQDMETGKGKSSSSPSPSGIFLSPVGPAKLARRSSIERSLSQTPVDRSLTKTPVEMTSIKANHVEASLRPTFGRSVTPVDKPKRPPRKSSVDKAGNKVPVARSGAKTPVDRSGAKTPVDRSGAKTPVDRSGAKTPVDRSGVKTPVDRSGAKTPVDRIGAKTPVDRLGAKTPVDRSGTKTPVDKMFLERPSTKVHKEQAANKTCEISIDVSAPWHLGDISKQVAANSSRAANRSLTLNSSLNCSQTMSGRAGGDTIDSKPISNTANSWLTDSAMKTWLASSLGVSTGHTPGGTPCEGNEGFDELPLAASTQEFRRSFPASMSVDISSTQNRPQSRTPLDQLISPASGGPLERAPDSWSSAEQDLQRKSSVRTPVDSTVSKLLSKRSLNKTPTQMMLQNLAACRTRGERSSSQTPVSEYNSVSRTPVSDKSCNSISPSPIMMTTPSFFTEYGRRDVMSPATIFTPVRSDSLQSLANSTSDISELAQSQGRSSATWSIEVSRSRASSVNSQLITDNNRESNPAQMSISQENNLSSALVLPPSRISKESQKDTQTDTAVGEEVLRDMATTLMGFVSAPLSNLPTPPFSPSSSPVPFRAPASQAMPHTAPAGLNMFSTSQTPFQLFYPPCTTPLVTSTSPSTSCGQPSPIAKSNPYPSMGKHPSPIPYASSPSPHAITRPPSSPHQSNPHPSPPFTPCSFSPRCPTPCSHRSLLSPRCATPCADSSAAPNRFMPIQSSGLLATSLSTTHTYIQPIRPVVTLASAISQSTTLSTFSYPMHAGNGVASSANRVSVTCPSSTTGFDNFTPSPLSMAKFLANSDLDVHANSSFLDHVPSSVPSSDKQEVSAPCFKNIQQDASNDQTIRPVPAKRERSHKLLHSSKSQQSSQTTDSKESEMHRHLAVYREGKSQETSSDSSRTTSALVLSLSGGIGSMASRGVRAVWAKDTVSKPPCDSTKLVTEPSHQTSDSQEWKAQQNCQSSYSQDVLAANENVLSEGQLPTYEEARALFLLSKDSSNNFIEDEDMCAFKQGQVNLEQSSHHSKNNARRLSSGNPGSLQEVYPATFNDNDKQDKPDHSHLDLMDEHKPAAMAQDGSRNSLHDSMGYEHKTQSGHLDDLSSQPHSTYPFSRQLAMLSGRNGSRTGKDGNMEILFEECQPQSDSHTSFPSSQQASIAMPSPVNFDPPTQVMMAPKPHARGTNQTIQHDHSSTLQQSSFYPALASQELADFSRMSTAPQTQSLNRSGQASGFAANSMCGPQGSFSELSATAASLPAANYSGTTPNIDLSKTTMNDFPDDLRLQATLDILKSVDSQYFLNEEDSNSTGLESVM